MYVPKQYEETRTEVLHALIEAHPFASLVCLGGGELLVNHLPVFLDPEPTPLGTLRCHVARANPVWRELSDTVEAIAVFQGPACYVSPSWYPSKYEHGKVVPTWNYAVVHAHGLPRAVEDRDWLLAHVSELTARQEASRAVPWHVTDAPEEFIDKMLGAIVGLEIPVTRLTGKWKVSQNKTRTDRQGLVAGLESRESDGALAMADLVRATLE